MQSDRYIDANRRHWDGAAPHHWHSTYYDVARFIEHPDRLQALEVVGVGDITGQSLLHLQCHFGLDTLSWVTRGAAAVTGVDFSGASIRQARELAERVGYVEQATFVEGDVRDLHRLLAGVAYDVVFTSYGTVQWLPTLDTWAQGIYDHLRPGGRFYFIDFHPVFWMLDGTAPQIQHHYFHNREPFVAKANATYAASLDYETTEYFWQYAPSEVIQPLLQAGLKLTSFREYDYSPHPVFPEAFELRRPGEYIYLRQGQPMPLTFELQFSKSA